MPTLEEIQDESYKAGRPLNEKDDEDDWDDEDSEILSDEASSDDEDEVTERGLALHEETIWERISALRDIVPPSTRHRIAANFSTASTYVYVGGRLVGGLAWVITTSALLVGLPYALAVEDEVRVAMQEREIAAQQSGAQHMMGPTGQQQQQGGIPGAGPGASAQGIRPPGF